MGRNHVRNVSPSEADLAERVANGRRAPRSASVDDCCLAPARQNVRGNEPQSDPFPGRLTRWNSADGRRRERRGGPQGGGRARKSWTRI